MESPQMYDSNQNNIPMAANTKPTTNGAAVNAANVNSNNNNNNPITLNANLKNDHVNGGNHLQKQMPPHPQQLLQHQQQQIQQVVQQYTQNDLEELTNPEISLDLANFIDDQFRSEQEQFAFFNKIVPAAINAGVNGVNGNGVVGSEAAKALQQARFQHRQNPQNPLQYIPGCVTGEEGSGSSSENASIKEEPIEQPIELRRLQQLTANGQFLNGNYQFQNGNANGATFTSLTPASVLHHQPHVPTGKFPTHPSSHLTSFQKLNKSLVSRKNSLKNVDKGTEEYRRRRERNNIAVRKSREKAKKRAHDVEKKMKDLQKENESLRRCDEEKTNVILLYNQVFMRLSNHANPEIKQIVSLELNSMNMQCDQGMSMQGSLLHNSYLTKDT